MYDQFYGLQGRPFQLTPDPHYYFESATHRKALSYLGYGLAQGEGFIVITGDIGAGKTTLVGHLMQTIDPARLTAVKIVSTQVEGDDMLRLAAQSFGLAVDSQPKAQILRQIEAFLHGQARAGRRTLLIVDEAQNLPVSAIEELRMLSNFQLGGQSLLQIFLLGQPEFRDLIKSPQLEQLRQRVIATHHLEPMMAQEVEPYILHRLSIAGWSGNPYFTPQAFAALYAATDGVPRRLNALTSRVLLLGAIEQLSEIDADVVQAVVADMGLDVDVTPEPVAPSALDAAEEEAAVEAEPEADWIEEPVAQVEESVLADQDDVEEVVDEAETAEATIPDAPVDEVGEELVLAPEQVEEEAPDEVEPGAQPFAAEPDTGPFARPAALRDVYAYDEAEDEDDYVSFDTPHSDAETRFDAPRFLRQSADPVEEDGVVEALAPEAVIADLETELDDVDDVDDAEMASVTEPEPLAEPEAIADPELVAVSPVPAAVMEEIEALRAEIASLRAMQSMPFTTPQTQTIDPDALKDCFTLIEERLASLEFRATEQDTALRRVLSMLVDWVEREEQTVEARQDFAAA